MVHWSVLAFPLAMLAPLTVPVPRETCTLCSSDRTSSQAEDPEELYRYRDNLPSAKRAAELWELHARYSFEPAWKLARISYWLGTKLPEAERRAALERGVNAGETAGPRAAGPPARPFSACPNTGARPQA